MRFVIVIALLIVGAIPAPAREPADYVVPINWAKFTAGAPTDYTSQLSAKVLRNTNRYLLMTWYPKAYGNQTGKYLNLGGVDQNAILEPACEAFAIAITLRTGAYCHKRAGKSAQEARAVAVKLAISVAKVHTSNKPTGSNWGYGWQTALWAHYTGYAAWLLWEDLEPVDRNNIARMVIGESDRFIPYVVPYYQDRNGRVITPGDTKAEENGWNANVIQLATSMMPKHQNWRKWMNKNIELILSSYATQSDLKNTTVYHGRPLNQWLNGSNIFENGTLVNHHRIHPDYMSLVCYNIGSTWMHALAGMATPFAAFRQANKVYLAFVNLWWKSPPYKQPGGTIFPHHNRGYVYYPKGDDWGTGLRMHFAYLDSQIELFGFDSGAAVPAKEWAKAHAEEVFRMQSRFPDGRTYRDDKEDRQTWREQWVAFYAAVNYMQRWLIHQGPIVVTNDPY